MFERVVIDRNLPVEIVNKINELENGRPYISYYQSYDGVITFGGTLALRSASEEELQQLSLSERKVANIMRYRRVMVSQDIDAYVKFALQQYYLNDQNFRGSKRA